MSEAMDLQATDLNDLNNLYNLTNILQGIILNLELIERGTIGKVISVSNANLFQIAAVEYGDARQWTTIANANGLIDPVIEATLTLILSVSPPAPTITINGIPASPQTITIRVNSINYTYNVTNSDTLNLIASRLGALIPGTTVINNIIVFQSTDIIDPNIVIQRVVNLVIPQQQGLPSGGILST